MEKKKLSRSKIIKIAKIVTFVALGAGVLFLLYPSIVNVISEVKKEGIISEWETQKKVSPEEEITSEDAVSEDDEESSGVADEIDSTDAGIKEETVDHGTLTAEDFFPLKIIIPIIDLEWIVNEGSDTQTLKEGPGHIIETPLPGDAGRCTISGHRTTYGSPFRSIDELSYGDLIYLETIKGDVFAYAVKGVEIVKPEDVYILEGTERKELLLTSCYPEYSAAERIILFSELVNIYPLGLEF